MSDVSPQDEYAGRVRAALALRDIKDFRGALEQLKRANALLPDAAEAWLLLGLTYQDLRRYRPAKQSLKRALELDADSREARMALGSLLLELGERTSAARVLRSLAESGDLAAAQAYARAVENDPGGMKRAILALEKALQLNPEDLETTLQLIQYSAKLGDPETTQRVADNLARNPTSSFSMIAAAMGYHFIGRYDEALALAEKATELSPGFDMYWIVLAVIASAIGNEQRALYAASRATELAPKNVLAWGASATVQFGARNFDAAIAAAEEALRLATQQNAPADFRRDIQKSLATMRDKIQAMSTS